MSEHATFTMGRFSPPTVGHQKLVDAVVNHSKKAKGEHYVFPTHTQDSKKNPLHHSEKVHFMKKFFPRANIADEKNVKTPIDAMKHLQSKGHKKVTMIVGSDRVQEMHNLLHKYNGKDYHFDEIHVKSAGQRDPDAEGVEGMSASKMRAHAEKKNFNEFKKGVPNKEHAKDLYHAVRKGMKLESAQKHFKAVFLVGGPGSGKDILIKSGLEESGMKELGLDKLYKSITENIELKETTQFESVFINGNADNFEKIDICRKVFEHMGYDTSMIFVYTNDSESKRRNDTRIINGSKTFSEDARVQKYNNSIKNMHMFSEGFSSFFLYDNSIDFNKATENQLEEIVAWTTELLEGVSEFISSPPQNSHAIGWLAENNKIDTGEINDLFEQLMEKDSVPVRATKSSRTDTNGDVANSGVANSSKNRAEPVTAEAKEEKKTSKEKVLTKRAVGPGSYYDSKIGTVPSGGIGLTAYKAESRNFSSF